MSHPSKVRPRSAEILVFFPTYNEVGNAERLIEALHAELPAADVLVIDDASTDGTGRLLDELRSDDPTLEVIHRPRKLGVGTAHKLALLYARKMGYSRVITMDADFSHHPRYLGTMLAQLDVFEFVTGSRYVEGGRCDYGLRRRIISRTANAIARIAVGLRLAENTTLFRGFTRDLLTRLDIDRIRSDGYSFAIESLFEISRVTDRLAEFPIHFEDRVAGDSKISRAEIYKAILTIARLSLSRVNPFARPTPAVRETMKVEPTICAGCGCEFQIERHPSREPPADGDGRPRSWRSPRSMDSAAYSCASHDSRTHGRILDCLQCGLIFMEPRVSERDLVSAYSESRDESYLYNMDARVQTFDYNLARVRRHIPDEARVLDVGSHCGVFLRVAESHSIDIMGVEPSSWAVEAASQVTSRPLVHGTLEDLPADVRSFDVVTMWDVLEHLYDPLGQLRRIHQLLVPDGTLMFSTIMIDNWFPRLMGAEWPWLMDMHLFYFTEDTIADMTRRAGFEVIESHKYCHIVTVQYLFEKLASLGIPRMKSAGRLIGRTFVGKFQVPFRFGDIQLFVCRRVDRDEAAECLQAE